MAVQPLNFQPIPIDQGYLRAKRIVDVTFTLLLLPALCLLLVILGLLVRLDSPGPIFYRQKRVGLNGKEFTLLKLRSMYADCDDEVHRASFKRYMNGEKLTHHARTSVPYKLEHDPRITRVGRFIRKTSLDELPQFFNVLRGEMTLVGPRPPIPYEVDLYQAHDWLRLSGKPGLTGYWQVYGRSQVTFQEMVELDIDYLRSQSLRQDLRLIVLTIPVMFKGHSGA